MEPFAKVVPLEDGKFWVSVEESQAALVAMNLVLDSRRWSGQPWMLESIEDIDLANTIAAQINREAGRIRPTRNKSLRMPPRGR